MSALFIGPLEKASLDALRTLAHARPIDMPELVERQHDPEFRKAHKARMTEQSITLPMSYLVTFSVEEKHPGGTAWHMSMSTRTPGRVPTPEAVWMVAEALGFTGGLSACKHWVEHLETHGVAVNLVQLVRVEARTDA